MITKDRFREYEQRNAFLAHNNISICDVTMDSATVKVELTKDSMNFGGSVHGGLLYTLCDCSAGLLARSDDRDYVTQSVHMNYLRNVREGVVYAKASVVNRGRKVTIIRVDVTSEEGKLLAQATTDMFCISDHMDF